MNKNLLMLIGFFLTGCQTTVNSTFTSAGEPAYRINCGGFLGDGDLGACYQKAGDLCQSNGYRIIQTSLGSLIAECGTVKQN